MKRITKYVNKQLNISSYINEHIVGKITHYNHDAYYNNKKVINTKRDLIEYVSSQFDKMADSTIDLSNLDVSKINDFEEIISRGLDRKNKNGKLIIDVSRWKFDENKKLDFTGLFAYCTDVDEIKGLATWDVSNVTTMERMFAECINLKEIDGIDIWDTHSLINAEYMFYNCKSIETLDLSSWDTSLLTTMNRMFEYCSKLKSIGASNWNISKLNNCTRAFARCESYDEDLSKWDVTKIDSRGMFWNIDINKDKSKLPIGVDVKV